MGAFCLKFISRIVAMMEDSHKELHSIATPKATCFRHTKSGTQRGPVPETGGNIDQITTAYGSNTNPSVLVNTDSVLNPYKA